MKIVDKLELLAAEMNIEDILLRPADLALDAGIWSSFPVPDCRNCSGRCCPPKLDLKLFDIARFMDGGLERFIEGTFELFMEHSLSLLNGETGVKHPFPYVTPSAESVYCRFLDDDHGCSIYESRICSCRSFPLGIVQYGDEDISLQWFGDQCSIVSDESYFWKLLDDAIQKWNEGIKNQILLMNARNQLREIGFGEYLGDECRYMLDNG